MLPASNGSTFEVPATLYRKPECGNQSFNRPRVAGKFLFVGAQKLWIKGVTYGTFKPDQEGNNFPSPGTVERDFSLMWQVGLNTVRTYTVPPRWLLDLAYQNGLYVMIGLPWEQHIAFLDDRTRPADIEKRIREGVQSCAGHPSVLAYSIGNEIPAPIVRWYGKARIENFLHRLYRVTKAEDPDALVTYVNYPTTEYLHMPFLDFVSFNVYLESKDQLEKYLARLHNIAGERPLLLAEIGLDSRRNGLQKQAEVLQWQVKASFEAGCAGALVFAWTDEWYRGGYDIEDWDFGITDRCRNPKPALAAVTEAFQNSPCASQPTGPKFSVVVCSYNGASTIRDCLEALKCLDYPCYEVIVVNDGSTDATESIVKEYDVSLISTSNHGLSSARNIGWQAAKGEIVAYIDDDAYPDPHWLTYLALIFRNPSYAGVGGPNLPPPNEGWIADCVANAPGGPLQVLINDHEAEHIPGCNMAFRRECLEAMGGFDTQYRTAGDDVDLCWRLREHGWKLGFHHSALVWHHRRNSVWKYWKQQQGYGHAEALLEKKWPDKYCRVGHYDWKGRFYGNGMTRTLPFKSSRVYQGVWGSALFQSLYQPAPNIFLSFTLMPEWCFVVVGLSVLTGLGYSWPPLLGTSLLLVVAAGIPLIHALLSGNHVSVAYQHQPRLYRWKMGCVTGLLHLIQPLARLLGRIRGGLTPWRHKVPSSFCWPKSQQRTIWSEQWYAAETWLEKVEQALKAQDVEVNRGGNFDSWDLEIFGGLGGASRLLMTIEEHGGGKQLLRFRIWPKVNPWALGLSILLGVISLGAAVDHAWVAASVLCWGMGGGIWFMARGYGSAMESALTAVQNCSVQSLRTTEGLSYGNLQEGKEKLLYLNSERQVKQEP